jgi:hypothetical protein
MTMFIIRVELHEATRQNYIDLANDLATKGITDVITGDNGNSYKMSPGEYNYIGDANIDAVLGAVQTSAAKTGRGYAVFVTQASQTKWLGLPIVEARRRA